MKLEIQAAIFIHDSKHVAFSKRKVKVINSHSLKVFPDLLLQKREKRRGKSKRKISLSIAISKVLAIQIARRELDDMGLVTC